MDELNQLHKSLLEKSRKVTNRSYDEIMIGDTASFTRTITNEDVLKFASLTDDVNPVHIDTNYAKDTIFKERIAHGMLTGSFISTLIGTILPGKGVIYLSQNCKFMKPVKIGDVLDVKGEVIDKRTDKQILTLSTNIFNQKDELVLEGSAVILKM